MNLPAEKLNLIEWLIHLQDQKVLNKIKALKEKNEIINPKQKLDPAVLERLVARAIASEQAITAGNVSDIESIANLP